MAAAGATADSPRMLGELFLRCSHCERSFTGPTAVAALRDHLMCAHSDPRGKGLCPLSPPDLKAADQASPDLNGLTSTAFVCAKCNASFSKKEHLDKHDLLHNPAPAGQDENAVLRKFKCTEPTCGKAFKFKHHLKEHMRIHSGEKPFECQHCRKRFSHSGSYSSHMTSKKCLIVNLKVRKMDTKAARGRASNGGSQNNNNNNTFRPIIPKFGAGGEVSVSPLAGSGPYLYDRFPFSAPDYGHSQSAPGGGGQGSAPQPFPSPYASPLALHHLLATQFPGSALPAHYLPLAPTYNEMAQILQARTAEKCGPLVGNGSSKTPSVDYVKKMFEFMESAAVKQDNGSPPPASKKNGLLPELLAAGPLHSSGADESDRYSSSCRRDYRCRHCKTASFDSPLALYQHERFMCSANRDVNRNLVQDLKVPKTEPGHESSSSDTNCDSGDEGELRSSKISEKGAMLLDTAFFINPSPGKKDIASLAQAIGSSTRAVRAWFENASKRPSSRASSYSPTSVPAKSVDFRSLLPASYAPGSAFGDAEPLLKSPRSNPPNDAEQPLDLSVKSKSGPSWSNGADSDNEYEALNLSRKSPRTSTPREGHHPASNGHSAVPERHLSPSARSFAPYAASEDYKMSLLHRHSPSPLLPAASKYLALSALKGYDLDGQVDLHRYRESFADRQQHGFPPVFSEPSSVAGLLLASPHAALSPPSADFIRSSTSSDSHDGTASPHGASNLCDGKMAVSPYYHDDPIDGEPGSPKMKAFQRRAFKQGELGSGAGDDSVAEDSPSTDDDPRQPGAKKRKLSARGDSASEEGMFSCDQCDKMFSKQSSLARHKYEHSGQRPHKCDVCEKAFKHKHHLTEHKRLHSGEKPFQCQKCLKRFSHSGSYSQHMNHRFSYCKPYRENGK